MSNQLITSVPDFKAFARAGADEAVTQSGDTSSDIFGKDGLSFGDVLDAINPLNHIPIVADVFANITGHKASAGSRLAGGALFGGPIGLVASLAGVLFEEGTGGKSPAEAVYASLTGGEPSTQVAENTAPSAADATITVASAAGASQTQAAAPVERVELAALAPAPTRASRIPIADAAKNALPEIPANAAETLLDLYGASAASAHGSYQKAQMLPYLRDVTVSKVL